MPRSGIAYHIDDAWRDRVRKALAAKGWKPAQFATEAGCPRSLVSELLSKKRHQTTYLPEMHAALGWDPPQPPIASPDTGEISYIFDRLDEAGRQRLIAKAREELDEILKAAKKPTAGTSKKNS
jgi:hypothetical protein